MRRAKGEGDLGAGVWRIPVLPRICHFNWKRKCAKPYIAWQRLRPEATSTCSNPQRAQIAQYVFLFVCFLSFVSLDPVTGWSGLWTSAAINEIVWFGASCLCLPSLISTEAFFFLFLRHRFPPMPLLPQCSLSEPIMELLFQLINNKYFSCPKPWV